PPLSADESVVVIGGPPLPAPQNTVPVLPPPAMSSDESVVVIGGPPLPAPQNTVPVLPPPAMSSAESVVVIGGPPPTLWDDKAEEYADEESNQAALEAWLEEVELQYQEKNITIKAPQAPAAKKEQVIRMPSPITPSAAQPSRRTAHRVGNTMTDDEAW